ncbi:serine/threonine protein kinase [Acinetobacter sp. WCHAc060006]|jgi:serine/threonine protein kinase|nr:serine/threonine protein kinase [Acinetobacter cumulans]RZG57820.1 serine/threonine protein kinase [Acinetobacter sp. WCHAc060006]
MPLQMRPNLQILKRFNSLALEQYHFESKAKPRSQSYGRHVYRLNTQDIAHDDVFWLKAQQKTGATFAFQGFEQELNCYRSLQEQQADFILPVQILSNITIPKTDLYFDTALILPEASAFFEVEPHLLHPEQVKHHLWQAISVMEQLNQCGWIHGDLKSTHFMQYQQRVCLIDLEQAQPLQQQSHTLNATPRYMAPELFHAEAKSIQTDLYALGIIFYEWLTGQRLVATDYEDWAYLHCQRLKIDLPVNFLRYLPLLEAMLAKHKSQRMHDFSQLKRCLMTEIA